MLSAKHEYQSYANPHRLTGQSDQSQALRQNNIQRSLPSLNMMLLVEDASVDGQLS